MFEQILCESNNPVQKSSPVNGYTQKILCNYVTATVEFFEIYVVDDLACCGYKQT